MIGDPSDALREAMQRGWNSAVRKARLLAAIKAGQAVGAANRWLQEQIEKTKPAGEG